MQTDGDDAYETLMQFLYRAPVALMQLRQDGEIEMLNPMAAQLLMPLSPDGDLASLFKVLEARAGPGAAVRRFRAGTWRDLREPPHRAVGRRQRADRALARAAEGRPPSPDGGAARRHA
jgi:hypothetical protein